MFVTSNFSIKTDVHERSDGAVRCNAVIPECIRDATVWHCRVSIFTPVPMQIGITFHVCREWLANSFSICSGKLRTSKVLAGGPYLSMQGI